MATETPIPSGQQSPQKRPRIAGAGLSETVKFNVGGRVFEVLREPTVSLHPDSLLHTLAEEATGVEAIFVEADPDLFPYILQYHRDRTISIPVTVSAEAVVREARKMGLVDVTPASIQRDGAIADACSIARTLVIQEKMAMESKRVESRARFLADSVICLALERIVESKCVTVTCRQVGLKDLWDAVDWKILLSYLDEWATRQGFQCTLMHRGPSLHADIRYGELIDGFRFQARDLH